MLAWETLAAQLHAEPTHRQLATALDVGVDVIEQLQALRRGHSSEVDASGVSRFDALAAPPQSVTVDERLLLRIAVDGLPERERVIVLGTFGAGLSQAEVAHVLRLSQSQVSKLLARALGKLSQMVA